MKIQINAKRVLREWPHVEKYQNTTLRYTPNTDFPKVMAKVIGRPQIIRLFVTLDEVWDYRFDTYDWNYLIGVNKYENDPQHYHYDWPLTEPSPLGVHEEDYLVSHASYANEVMLNIRRYEREVIDGIISLDTYEAVLERVIEHYKNLCPNIHYIECCNEVEIENFGNLKMSEYYKLYKRCYVVVQRLNNRHHYDMPLLVGGFGMSAGVSNWKYWEEFLVILSKDEDRKIDFYSMHEYHTNPARILEFYVRHHAKLKELNLPRLPIMMSEYGLRVGIGDAGRPHNLQNASGEIPGLILSSYCEDLKVFPWCTFHNPNQQLGRTMFLQISNGCYVPTPSGHVMTMFHMLGNEELLIEDYCNNQAVATKEGNCYCVLISHPQKNDTPVEIIINDLMDGDYEVYEYLVDEQHNNILTNKMSTSLKPTNSNMESIHGRWTRTMYMQENSFCLWVLKHTD